MRTKQSADNMMKTPVPRIKASIDLTQSPPLVIEYIDHVNRVHTPSYLDTILSKETSNRIKISYYLRTEVLRQEIIRVNEILFTPKDTCFNISVEIKDKAPIRTAINADIHGFFVWGSEAISYWQSNIANNKYYIVRKPYNLEVQSGYIIFGKTEEWIREIKKRLTPIPVNELYPRKILIVEGEEYIDKDLVFTKKVEEVHEKVLEAITFNIHDSRIRKLLVDYMIHHYNNTDKSHIANNVFIGLEKLYGLEKMEKIIKKLLTNCQQTIINEDKIFEILSSELGIIKNVLRRLFKESKKVLMTMNHGNIVIEGIHGSSIVELEILNNGCIGRYVFLVDEKHKITITTSLEMLSKQAVRYNTY